MVVEKNNKVTVEYEGRFDSKKGEIFDSSEGRAPLTFIAGIGMVVPGFDNAIIGMKKGEEKEITLKPEEAYGPHNDQLTQKVPRDALPKDQDPEAGMTLMIATPQGQQIPVQIIDVNDKEITIDVNHPLAGKTLYFKIKLVDFEEFSEEELKKLQDNIAAQIQAQAEAAKGHKHSHNCNCNCAEDDPCKTGEEDCKCEDKKKKNSKKNNSPKSSKNEPSIEDLAEGK